MTKQQAIRESIAHWERMIAWVKTQPKRKEPDDIKMTNQIGENWYSDYCPLCSLYHEGGEPCTRCPLHIKWGSKIAWFLVDISPTWDEWLRHARKMLRQLKSLEER